MIINSNYIQSISRQSGSLFSGEVRLSDAFQSFEIGLSGYDILNFSVSGNRIYDSDKNFICGLNSDSIINFKIKHDETGALVTINNELLSFNSGNFSGFDYIYVNNTGQLDLDLYLYGDDPIFTYSGINSFSDGVNTVTGVIINLTPERVFRINSGEIISSDIAGIFLSGFETGNISTTGALYFSTTESNESVSGLSTINLYTNFGTESFQIDLSLNSIEDGSYINFSPSNLTEIITQSTNSYIYESFYRDGLKNLNIKLDILSLGSGVSDFTEVWDLQTGKFGLTPISHKDNGWFNSSGYWNSGNSSFLQPNFINQGNINVYFDGSVMSGESVARLYITDGEDNFEIFISGQGL